MNSGEDQHSHHSDHHSKQDDKNEVQHMTNEIKSAVQELDDSSSSGSSASDTGSAACNGQYKIASKKNSVKDDENANETDTSIDESDEDGDESETDDESDGDEDDDEDDDNDDEDDVIRGIRRMRRGAEYFDSDSSDDQSDRCPICLNRFIYQEVGTPESCDHNFCLDCIQEWARNVNTCPVDRQVFTLILVRPKLDTNSKISRKIIIENKQLEDEEDVEEDQTFCEICGSSDREDRLLLCDGCDLGYHLECLDPPLDSVPVEEWFCPDCSIENQLPLAEEVGIREDELAGLLGDNPPDLGLPVLRPRGRRLVPRTRQSERVRRRILRNRNTALSNGVSEDQTSHSGIESQQNVTKKTSVRRKRITGTKRKKKRTRKKKKTLKKIGLVGAKKSTRKRRRRKKRKLKKGKKTGGVKARVVLPLSIKARIANHLGLKKPPPGHSLPLMRSISHPKTLNHQRHDVGIPTLNIFGSRDELDVFPESYSDGDVLISLPSLPQAIPRNKLRASSLILSHHRISESMRSSRRIIPQVPFQAHSEPVTFDVVGSILNGQSVLHTKSKDIAISRDGSLNVLPRFTDKQLVHQRPASPNPSSKGSGRTGSSNAPISSCPGQNYSGERPGYGHWSSLLNENESNQAYAEYYRTANSNDETRTYSGSGDECSGNNGHNNNAKDKNKKNEKEKKPVTNEYDDIDIYSDIEPGFENDETYSGIEDSMATSMDLVQDDCINHSDISSEDDLVIDESIKQDDYDDNDDDDDGNSELKQRSLMEQANSEENISSSSENDLIIDEEPHRSKTETTNIATGVHKNFDEQNETDSSDSDQVTEELEKVSQEFSKQKDYSNNFLEESNEKGTDSDDGDEGEDKSDNDLASECSQSQRDTRVSEEQEQSDIDIDVECVTEQEHSDVDVEEGSPQPIVSYDVNDIDLPVEREKNTEVKEDQNDDADDDQDDVRVSGDENEDVDVGSDHSPCSEIDEKLEEQENYSLSTKEINNRIQQEVIKSIEELNNSNCCTDSKQEESVKELLSTEVNNTVDKMENAEIVPSEENPVEKQCTEIAHNLCSIMDDSCQISENKDIKNTDYDHEIIEEGEIPNTEESERKKYRRKKEASQHSSSRRSHHTSSKSHRDSGDHEEGEIVDDSPPRRSKDRNKLKNVLRDVSPDEYDYDMPRKNISELPRIPKIKRDKTVKEGTEAMLPISVDSKRTSVLSRLDIGSANEISWKKLSKSSKERNYRDGKPKDETKYFREREIKEKKDDKKRKPDSVDKKEKKPSDHERHKNDWPREKEKDKRDKRSVEKDRHKEKHRNKHKEKEKERHKHNRPTEIVPEKRKERDRREREMHEKREKPEKKEKEKKEKREKSRSGERSHRDEKHREHKKKVEKVVLASRETSPIESKEVYTSGDSIIVNVSFNRSLQREGKSREGKTKNKENRESKRTFPPESSSREHKKIRISEPEVIWSEKPKEIPLEKVIKNYPPQSPPSSPPLPPPPPREHKRKPESVRKEVISPEPPRPSIIKWKPICEEEEDDEITEIVTSEKSLKSNESDSQDCVVTEEIENIESPNEPETLPSDAENDVADDNESLVEIHSPHEKINEDSTATNEPPEDQLESPPSPTDDSVYDPFEPTKSPSLSPVLSETKSTNDPNANNDTILPPPLPELPPLPPEPEPLEPPPPIPVNKDISHSSPSFTMQIPPKIPPQLSASPVSLPNVRIPPPNFIPRAVPPNGTTAMQIAPPLRPMGWPVGTPGVIYTAPAQSIIRGGFLPPTLTTAPVPVSTQSVSLNQIGTLLHTQAQLAILSAVRPPSGPPLSAVPPTIAIPPPLLSCPPPQLAPTTIPIQQPISNATQNGETRRPIVQQPDVTEVVDMEMESPYSPGEDVPEIPSPEKKSISVSVHSEKSKDKFDLLLGTVKSIASRQQEKQPTHITRGRVSNDRTSRQSSQQRLDNRSISNAVSDSRKRSSENYSSSSSKKHIVRFEIPDRKAAQKKDKKLEEGGKKEVTLRLDETQLKILDELPSSAVEMQVKEKFLKKLNRQERVIEEVKLAIKPYYNRREISKEDYKEILRKSVPKICHNKSGEINPVKIRALVEGYVRKFKYHHKKETKFQPMGGKKS